MLVVVSLSICVLGMCLFDFSGVFELCVLGMCLFKFSGVFE